MGQMRDAHLSHLRSTRSAEGDFSENLFAGALICETRLVVMRRALPVRETRKIHSTAGDWQNGNASAGVCA
jgi:hypothetical protein